MRNMKPFDSYGPRRRRRGTLATACAACSGRAVRDPRADGRPGNGEPRQRPAGVVYELRRHARRPAREGGRERRPVGVRRARACSMRPSRTRRRPPSTPDHSTTNMHEAGVDEPDLVKTDGNRVITVSGGVLRVVDAATRKVTGSLRLSDDEPALGARRPAGQRRPGAGAVLRRRDHPVRRDGQAARRGRAPLRARRPGRRARRCSARSPRRARTWTPGWSARRCGSWSAASPSIAFPVRRGPNVSEAERTRRNKDVVRARRRSTPGCRSIEVTDAAGTGRRRSRSSASRSATRPSTPAPRC